jgi:hypothetical protein
MPIAVCFLVAGGWNRRQAISTRDEERTMKTTMAIGLILIVLGVLALGYQGVAWITTRDTVARVGPVEVQTEREHPIPLAPILSGVAIVGGAALLIAGASRKEG